MTSEKDTWRAVVNVAINDYLYIMACFLWRRNSNPEPTMPASERQQTDALDRPAIWIGTLTEYGAMCVGKRLPKC